MSGSILGVIALVLGAGGLCVSIVAYWRSGGRWKMRTLQYEIRAELEAARQAQRALADELAARIRMGYEDTLERMRRAEARLSEPRQGAPAELTRALNAAARRASELRQQAWDGLDRLRKEASTQAQNAQEAVARRARRLEARVEVLVARGEIARAERLAEREDFVSAQSVLEDAASKVRHARSKMGDPGREAQAFDEIVGALAEAIRRVRLRAANARQQIEKVMTTSDSLLGSLEARDQPH